MDVSQELKLLKMTETKNGTEAIESQDPNVTELKIIRQIEYYFGDYNLSRDKFLKDTIKNDDGWVAMETMLKFQRLAQLSKDSAEIIKSLKKSSTGLMEVDEEKARIRRSPSKPLPENEIVQKEQAKMKRQLWMTCWTSSTSLQRTSSMFSSALGQTRRQRKGFLRGLCSSPLKTGKVQRSSWQFHQSKILKVRS